jgi:uncharacterized protein YkwD
MVRTPFILLIFLFCSLLPGVAPPASSDDTWDNAFYDRFDAESFRSYEAAQKPIDFRSIHYPLLNAAIFFETNRVRTRSGRKPFIHSAALEAAAFMHAKDMVEQGFFSHQNPRDREKRTLPQRLALFGVHDGYRAENISEMFGIRYEQGAPLIPPAPGSGDFRDHDTGRIIPNHSYISFAESLLGAWMDSPGHRANILNRELLYLGCGAYHYISRDFYGMHQFKAVQNFASVVPEE